MSSFSDVDAASGPMRLDRKDEAGLERLSGAAPRKGSACMEGVMLEVRYPNVEVRITEEYPWGYDGEDEEFYSVENPDAAGILERVRGALLREGGVGDEEIEAYTTEATSRCYNHLLLTTMTWVRIHWDVPGYATTP